MDEFKTIFERHYTWIEGFMRNVRRYGKRTAMIDPEAGKTWTYEELNQDTNRLCNALLHDGLVKGDVVMMMLPNCAEFVFTYIASHKTHTVNSPVSFRLSSGELSYNLEDARPKVMIFDSKSRATVMEAIQMAKFRPQHLVITDAPSDTEVTSFADYVAPFDGSEPPFTCEYNIYDETTRLFTSGTTGRPKGVPLTSINEVLSSHDVMIHFPMCYKDVTMNTTPWFHRGGLHCAGPCPTFYAGASLVIMGKFDPALTLQYAMKYKITFIIGVPTVLESLADEQERKGYDLGSLKGIVTMGSPLQRSACIRYQKVLTPNIFNGYGTTETFWNTFLRPFDLPENAGTAGSSCIDDDVRVVRVYEEKKAEPDEVVAKNGREIGEVIISSPAKSPYMYSDNPKETEAKYYKNFIYTGDVATWDENSFLTILGRKDDMIISSGENIYPTQVEEVLNSCPKVKDCMVTGVPDSFRGQIVTAYIVKDDESLTAEELDQFMKDSPMIANFKRPRYYRFVNQLPYNATGKKIHYKLKEIAIDDLKNGLLIVV